MKQENEDEVKEEDKKIIITIRKNSIFVESKGIVRPTEAAQIIGHALNFYRKQFFRGRQIGAEEKIR